MSMSPSVFGSKALASMALWYQYHISLWENFEENSLRILKNKEFTRPGSLPNNVIVIHVS